MLRSVLWCSLLNIALLGHIQAAPASQPADAPGEPVLEEPTMHCLGVYWIVAGDEQKELRIDLAYRQAGAGEWKNAMPLFRARKGDTLQTRAEAQLNPAGDAWLFAGSVVDLTPDTEYELKLAPSKGGEGKILKARTAAEPIDPPGLQVRHVGPGNGGGDGSEANPYKGLAAAQAGAKPGTLFLLHKGTYPGPFRVTASGEVDRPIIWRGFGDGPAIIQGKGKEDRIGVELTGKLHDVRFEELTIQGFFMAIRGTDNANLVIRRCAISQVNCGIYCDASPGALVKNIFIADNDMNGPFTWGTGPLGASTDEWRGIQLTGIGHQVAYNRIRNFKDGVDTFPSKYCASIDIHHNEIMNSKDDGIEMDFSQRNNRCFDNRLTNVHQGISEQPIFGGPVYVFRNSLYNVGVEPFKLHNNGTPGQPNNTWPSGALLYHNTIVKKDEPFILYTSAPVYNCVTRNNLFIGGGKRAFNFDAKMVDCDFDYDGFGGGPWEIFAKWEGVRYPTFEEMKAKCPVEKHAVLVEVGSVFAADVKLPQDTNKEYPPQDLRPSKSSAAAEAGQLLPNFNDGFAGKAPALGAYPLSTELPHFGPRLKK